jgi:hypothetical protein
VALGLLALALAVLLVWPVPELMYPDPPPDARAVSARLQASRLQVDAQLEAARLQARANTRTAFVAGIAGVAALAGLALNARNVRINQETLQRLRLGSPRLVIT